jgi:hypothetical protein
MTMTDPKNVVIGILTLVLAYDAGVAIHNRKLNNRLKQEVKVLKAKKAYLNARLTEEGVPLTKFDELVHVYYNH